MTDYAESTACTRHRPEISAGCAPTLAASHGVATVETGAGRYLPPYYYAVGWPGRLDSGLVGFYGMRLASLVVSSILLALAISTVLRTIGARWASLVLPIAITPQVLWLGSAVNPNAWELDGGLLAWAAGLALVSGLSTERRESLWAKFLVGAAALVLMRRLSPLWLVLILAGVLAVRLCLPAVQRPSLRGLASRRAGAVLGVLVCLVVLSVWWHLTFDLESVNGVANPQPAPGGFLETLTALVPDVPWWLDQTYGVFGWLDTASPEVAILTWLTLGGATFALVVIGSRHRLRVSFTVGVGVALCVAIPMVFSVTVGRQVGIHFWQGRYTMPFAQGIPLAMGVLGASWRGASAELGKLLRLAASAAWLMWPGLGTLTFVWALHRFAKGQSAGWGPANLAWSPPGGMGLLVALYAVAGVVLVRSLREEPGPRQEPANSHEGELPSATRIGTSISTTGSV